MRTAEEHFEAKRFYNKWMEELNDYEKEIIIDIIKEVQKETIEECAEAATTTTESFYGRDDELHDRTIVNQKSILSLIEQVK